MNAVGVSSWKLGDGPASAVAAALRSRRERVTIFTAKRGEPDCTIRNLGRSLVALGASGITVPSGVQAPGVPALPDRRLSWIFAGIIHRLLAPRTLPP